VGGGERKEGGGKTIQLLSNSGDSVNTRQSGSIEIIQKMRTTRCFA